MNVTFLALFACTCRTDAGIPQKQPVLTNPHGAGRTDRIVGAILFMHGISRNGEYDGGAK